MVLQGNATSKEYFYGRWEDIAYVLSGKKDEAPFLEKLKVEDTDLHDFKVYIEDDRAFLDQ